MNPTSSSPDAPVLDRLTNAFAVRMARSSQRRTFMRNSAKGLFYGSMYLSTGTAGLVTVFSEIAGAQTPTGPGCPTGCGGSPCCETTDCATAGYCCQGGQGNTAQCQSNDICLGLDLGGYPTTGCWTSNGKKCCDCVTNRTYYTKWCPNPHMPNTNRCICWKNA